jgi:hypothetical protein
MDPANNQFPAYMLVLSVLVHVIIFLSIAVLLNISLTTPSSSSGYIQVMSDFGEAGAQAQQPEEVPQEAVSQEPKTPDEQNPSEDEVNKDNTKPQAAMVESAAPEAGSANMSFNSSNTDTSSLNNVYSEKTLNVSMKYPQGWAYIDQNRKNKLDGVTFMATAGNIKPPPYVHLAVQSKDMFIESRYKYSIKTWSYIAYYNDPVEMAGQVSQVFYIRTESSEDYSIKFIMSGRENFEAFKPVFFGMVKTFKFGNVLF